MRRSDGDAPVAADVTDGGVRGRRLVPHSFRTTIVGSTVLLMSVAVVVMVLGVQLLLARTAQNDIQTVLDERADSALTVVQRASTDRLVVPADTLEPGIQVFDASGRLVAGTVERDVRATALDLSRTTTRRTVAGPHDEERLLGVPFTTPSGQGGVLVVSRETGPYERSEFYALLATGGVGVLVVAVSALIALRVTRQALQPVTRMAQRASEWSEHDLTHRFALGPPTDELGSLGATLDHLLDRVASAIRNEQRLTAELAHELRTPLTSIQGSAGLALMRGVADPEDREDFEEIHRAAQEMSTAIRTLLDVARQGSTTSDQGCTLAEVVGPLVGLVEGRAGEHVVVEDQTAGSTARVAAPRELVVRAVAPLVDNAVRYARARVRLTARDFSERVELVVHDDGPGVGETVRDRLFEPGATDGSGGAGLGLGIARRVARSFGGEIRLEPRSDGAGTDFVVTLPRR